ncbi:unknown protein [Microcystis aeruginosa NIES-843]|uniref:Uncharacterized protein n=1 Tax=Microcystis aeruginosa (strain NIES-843 / IAM M-2473) TaxID=449447 RepID=B0JPV6_MICAN|nr:unknown protein [Microcystis aeruginosa NIES-843]
MGLLLYELQETRLGLRSRFLSLVQNCSEPRHHSILTDILHIFIYFYIFLHSPSCFDEKSSL